LATAPGIQVMNRFGVIPRYKRGGGQGHETLHPILLHRCDNQSMSVRNRRRRGFPGRIQGRAQGADHGIGSFDGPRYLNLVIELADDHG